MRDLISIERIKDLHPKIRAGITTGIETAEEKLGQYAAVRIVQGFRSFSEQNALYAIGRTVKGFGAKPGLPMGHIVTKAKGGQGYHNYGLAIDFALLYDKDKNGTLENLSWDLLADLNRDGEADWKEVVDSFKALAFEWGGDWTGGLVDNPHIQMTFGYSWQSLLEKYNKFQFIPGTKFVNI